MTSLSHAFRSDRIRRHGAAGPEWPSPSSIFFGFAELRTDSGVYSIVPPAPMVKRPNSEVFKMKSIAIVLAVATLAVSSLAVSHSAEAAGCLKGAAVGGMAGHYAGNHGLLGAGIGCAVGHHEATKHEREQDRHEGNNEYR